MENNMFVNILDGKEIPLLYPEDMLINTKLRNVFTQRFGMWALVDRTWTAVLADVLGQARVIEVMSGAGWLAKALSDYGVNINAFDSGVSHQSSIGIGAVFPVTRQCATEAVADSDADILLMSWPPYQDTVIDRISDLWGYSRTVICVGEKKGATGTVEWWDRFDIQHTIEVPQWSGIYDRCYIGRISH